MMIKLGKREFQFFMSSGMMGFDGNGPTIFHRKMFEALEWVGLCDPSLFAITLKTISYDKVIGRKRISPIWKGYWNHYGLDNPGYAEFFIKYQEKIENKDNIIISIAGSNIAEILFIIDHVNKFLPMVIAIEINGSCPNDDNIISKETERIVSVCDYAVEKSNIPIILKLGVLNNYIALAKSLEGVICAISINSIPAKHGGAISGKRAQKINFRILQELKGATSIPVIASSIWNFEDMEKVHELGADAIAFGSMSMVHPLRPWGPILPTLWARKYLMSIMAST